MSMSKEKMRVYNKSPEGIYRTTKSRFKQRGIQVWYSKDTFVKWFESQPCECFYCHRQLVSGSGVEQEFLLTIDRMDNSKEYSIDNIVLCCFRCNSYKSHFLTSEDMIKIGEVVHQRMKELGVSVPLYKPRENQQAEEIRIIPRPNYKELISKDKRPTQASVKAALAEAKARREQREREERERNY